MLEEKLVKRGVSLKGLEYGDVEEATQNTVRQVATIKVGISSDKAREINKLIKEKGPKGVSSQTQGESVRVTSKKRDDLQAVMQALREADLGIPIQFDNRRDDRSATRRAGRWPGGCGCLLVLLGSAFPRIALVPHVDLHQPRSTSRSTAAVLLPLAGLIFLPYTTLFYVIAYAPIVGVSAFGWIFVAFGVLLDLANWFGGGREGRRRAPASAS